LHSPVGYNGFEIVGWQPYSATRKSYRFTITNNDLYGNTAHGMFQFDQGIQDVYMSDNHFWNNTLPFGSSFATNFADPSDPPITNITIMNMTSTDSVDFGIANWDGFLIENLTLTNGDDQAMNVGASGNVFLANNRPIRNGTLRDITITNPTYYFMLWYTGDMLLDKVNMTDISGYEYRIYDSYNNNITFRDSVGTYQFGVSLNDKAVSGATVEYTTGKVFTFTGSGCTVTPLRYYPTKSNTSVVCTSNQEYAIVPYNMTIQPAQDYVTVTNTTTNLSINYTSQHITRVNFTVGSDVSSKAPNLLGLLGTTYDLYYAGNNTLKESQTASSNASYFASVPSGSYYILEDGGTTYYPQITGWENNKTNNQNITLTVNKSEDIKFNISFDIIIDTYTWLKDDVDTSTDFDNYITSWSTVGTKTVKAYGTNTTNGTSETKTWTVTVQSNDPAPIITSWENNQTNNNNLTFTIERLFSVLFNVSANQTITNWIWSNVTIISGNGTTESNASKNFSVIGTFYTTVYGTNDNGSTNYTNWTVTVQDTTAPAQVTGLTNNTPTTSSVTLSWDANTEDDLWGYQIFRNSSHLGYTQSESYIDSTLTESTSYEYKVRANDTTLWGTNSSTIIVNSANASNDFVLGEGGNSWDSNSTFSGIMKYNDTGYLYLTPPIMNGLIHFYPLENTTGSTAYDDIGNAQLTLGASHTWNTTGIKGNNSLRFTGGSELNTGIEYDLSNYTIIISGNVDDFSTYRPLFWEYNEYDSNFISGTRWQVSNNNGTAAYIDNASLSSSVTGTNHVFLHYRNNTTGVFGAYLDQASIGTGSRIGALNDQGWTFRFGGNSDGYKWKGLMDYILIYNRVLTTSELSQAIDGFGTTGNLTVWRDVGTGYVTGSLSGEFSIFPGTNFTVTAYDNDTNAEIQQWTGITDASWSASITGTKSQDTKINVTYFSNGTQTPVVKSVTFTREASGSEPESDFIPPNATSLSQTNASGNGLWINQTWLVGIENNNITDSYNYSVNGSWTNGSLTNYTNTTVSAHDWKNITVWAYNSSGNGTLSNASISLNTQIQNNPPVQSAIGNKNVNEGILLTITISSTDADSDTLTYGTNATKGSLNSTTGVYTWTPTYSDSGVYTWYFNTTDNYSAVATETITVTVVNMDYIPPTPTSLSETNGSYWVNYTWSVGSGNVTDSYNLTLVNNSITYYINGSSQNWTNSTLGSAQWSNITVQAYNSSGNGTLNSTGISQNTQAPTAPEVGCGSFDGTNVYVSATGNDSDNGTLACPYLTINKGNQTVYTGGTVWITNGTYYNETITPANASVTFERYNGTVIMDNVTASTISAFTVTGLTGVKINNLTINNYKQAIKLTGASGVNVTSITVNSSGAGVGAIETGATAKINISSSDITSTAGYAVHFIGNLNTITNSNLTGKGSSSTLYMQGDNNNITNVTVHARGTGHGLVDETGSDSNTILNSTANIWHTTASKIALYVKGNSNIITNTVSEIKINSTTDYTTEVDGQSNVFENLTSIATQGVALRMSGGKNNQFLNSTLNASTINLSSSAHVVSLVAGSNNNIYNNVNIFSWYSDGTSYGFVMANSNNVSIQNSNLTNQKDRALSIVDSDNFTITNSIVYGGKDGIDATIGGKGASLTNITNSTITNNTFSSGVGREAFYILNSSDDTFSNNTYWTSGTYSGSQGFSAESLNNSTIINDFGDSTTATGYQLAGNSSGNILINVTGNGTLPIVIGSGTLNNILSNYNQSSDIRINSPANIEVNDTRNVFNETSSGIANCYSDTCYLNLSGVTELFSIIPFLNLSVSASNSTITVNDVGGANFTITNNVGTVSRVNYSNVTNGYLYYLNKDNTETITSATATGDMVAFEGLTLADGTYEIENNSIIYIPPTPTSLSETNGSYWVNYTWQAGAGNVTDSFNVSQNNIWINGTTALFNNSSVGASGWSNITVCAYNNSGVGSLSSCISQNTQAPDAPINTYIPPNATTMTYTNGSTWVNHTWQAGSGNVTDSYNITHNGAWIGNGTTNLYYNITVGAGAWSNITVFAYNNSGSGTLNATGISQNVQTPAGSFTASNNIISCPVGWCHLAMNYTNKTLTQLDAMFSTDIVQGWFNSTSQKFESHSLFSKNQNVNVTQKSGYFYYFYSPTTVYVNITENPSIDLKTGWNLVGNMDTNRTLSELETSIGGTVITSSHWNNTEQQYQNDAAEMVLIGESFFVNVNANSSWGG